MKIVKWVLLGAVLIQLIPFGRNQQESAGDQGTRVEFTGDEGIDPPGLL